MAVQSNLKSKKCWSCIYFGGKRKINRFLSITIESDDKGTCMCPKCPHSGKTVFCDNSCPKWQIDKVTFDAQREVEQKKIEKENKKIEQKRREEEIENERKEQRERRGMNDSYYNDYSSTDYEDKESDSNKDIVSEIQKEWEKEIFNSTKSGSYVKAKRILIDERILFQNYGFEDEYILDQLRQKEAAIVYKNGNIMRLNGYSYRSAIRFAKNFPNYPISKKIMKKRKIYIGILISEAILLIFILLFAFIILPLIVDSLK